MAPAFWSPFSSAARAPASSPEHQHAARRPEGSPTKAGMELAPDERIPTEDLKRKANSSSPSGDQEGGQQRQAHASEGPSSDPAAPGALLTSRPPALSLDRLPFRTMGSLALSAGSRSASCDSEQSSVRTDVDGDGGLGGADSGFARLSAASSVSSLHASDDGRSGAGLETWLKAAGDAVDGRLSSTPSIVAREEATPRAERPPVLELATAATTVDAVEPGIASGSSSPSYFPSPTETGPFSASAADKRSSVVSPPPASRSPSFPPPSSFAASRPIAGGRSSSIDTPSIGERPSWRSSVFSTSSSSGASFSTTASSSISSQYGLSSSFGSITSACGGAASSSSSACSVSTPVLPRPWLASDQLLTKSGPVDDMRDEAALLVETTDESYVVVACLPGFSLDCITLATKSRRTLHIVADRWERSRSAHFERKVTFGADADLARIRAQFDGEMLRVTVARRQVDSLDGISGKAKSFTSLAPSDGGSFSSHYHHRASAPSPAAGGSSPWGTGSDGWAASTVSTARPVSNRSASSSSLLTGADDSAPATVRAKHTPVDALTGPDGDPDAAVRRAAEIARSAGGLDELLARAKARDGGQYI